MDRQIVYPYEGVQDTDILLTNKNAMIGLGYALQAILGSGTLVDGLACTATSPASMSVNVASGSIYSLEEIDATAYGTAGSDTANQVVKQGIKIGTTNFSCPAPSTTGQSVVYLIQAELQESDSGSTSEPFVNSTDGTQYFSSVNTVRKCACTLSLKAGTAATTGTQVAPTPDAGYVGLWTITVANGASTIVSGNIAQYPGAPFIGNKLTAKVATINRRVFTSSGTYTPSAGLLYALVEVQGGGGGGGGAPGGTGSQASAATGGAEGGYCSKFLTAAQIGASQTVTVGAAGSNGGAGNTNGGGGGSSSFGSLLTANGGSPGGGQSPQSSISLSNAPGVGGSASGGDINIQGGPGGYGLAFGGYGIGIGGKGADSRYGRGGPGGASGSGGNSTGYGAGGGGAGASTSDQPGGSGAPGATIITEYCA